MIEALLAHGANPNAPLKKGPPEVGSSRASTEGRNLTGATPFLLAAKAADVKVIRILVDHGADLTLGTNEHTTLLMVAAGLGRIVGESLVTESRALDAVRLAFDLGVDVNAANDAGETVLHGAANIRANALVQLLVDRGAVVNGKDKRGETPLMNVERTFGARTRHSPNSQV